MDNQDFKAIWQASDNKNFVKFKSDELSNEIISKLDKFNKAVKRNAYTEIVVAIILIPVFSYLAIEIPFMLSKIGAIIIALSMVHIIYKMLQAQKKEIENFDLPMQEFLSNRKQQLLKQIQLIDNVLYWYILPPGIGVLLFVIGASVSLFTLIISLVLSVLIYVFIYIINKRAVHKRFNPLLEELESYINELNK